MVTPGVEQKPLFVKRSPTWLIEGRPRLCTPPNLMSTCPNKAYRQGLSKWDNLFQVKSLTW